MKEKAKGKKPQAADPIVSKLKRKAQDIEAPSVQKIKRHLDSGPHKAPAAAPKANDMKGKKRKSALWDNLDGWEEVEVGDDFLLGAEEGGFAGLEVIDDPDVLQQLLTGQEDGNGEQPAAEHRPSAADSDEDEGPASSELDALDDAIDDAGTGIGSGDEEHAPVDEATAAAAAAEEQRKQKRERQKAIKEKRKERRRQRLLQQKQQRKAAASAATAAGTTSEVCDDAALASDADVDGIDGGDSDNDQQEQQRPGKRAATAAAPTAVEEAGPQDGPAPDAEPLLPDMSAWAEFELHPSIVRALALQGFSEPTPIQRECLGPAIRARADIIGAAQTGSGKTLAFGLPIMQLLVDEVASTADDDPIVADADADADSDEGGDEEAAAAPAGAQRKSAAGNGHGQHPLASRPPAAGGGKLRALVLTPTRELALQVATHMAAIGKQCGVRMVAIVGGISDAKQARLLAARPAVIVATPGRLWDLMCRPPSSDRNGPAAADHLADLSRLSFLVLDEADRMVQQGHYKELEGILSRVPNPRKPQQDTLDAESKELMQAKRREKQERQLRKQQQAAGEEGEEEEEGGGIGDEEDGASEEGEEGEEEEEEGANDVQNDPEAAPSGKAEGEEEEADAGPSGEGEEQQQEEPDAAAEGARGAAHSGGRTPKGFLMQTFVFSATLTLPLFLKKRIRRGGGGAGGGAATLESLMNRVPFGPRPRIVDLTTRRKLASGVCEAQVACLEDERDALLYYLLAHHPGRTLVFANAVSAIRRMAALLKTLGLPVYALHAQQQQRQRFNALDRFSANPQGIMVATDVAARGLDIRGVDTVVHYQLPASADTYIHRCGRTARGSGTQGIAIALVTPREAARFVGLARALERELPPSFPVDLALMPKVKARMKLAMKLDDLERRDRKVKAEHSWRQSNAKALGLALSDDEEGSDDGELAERTGGGAGGREAAMLRQQLAALLAEPLVPKMSSRYFTGGLAAALATRTKAVKQPGAAPSAEVPAAAAAAVPQAVALAARLHQSHQAAAAGVQQQQQQRHAKQVKHSKQQQQQQPSRGQQHAGAKGIKGKASTGTAQGPGQARGRGKGKGGAQGGAAGGRGARGVVDPRLLVSRNQLKKQSKRGMVVIPQAFGRESQGPNALQALQKRLALLG